MDYSAKTYEVLLKISNSLEEIKSQMQGKQVAKPVSTPSVPEQPKPAEKAPEPAKPAPAQPANNLDWYDKFVEQFVVPVVNASNTLGDKFVPIGEIFDILFSKLLKEILQKAAVCKMPTEAEMATLFAPVKDCNTKLDALNRDRDFPVNYVKAMREIIGSIFWVNVNDKPENMVQECLNSATFWIDRIRKDAKNKMDNKPMEWSKLVIALMKELIAIIADRFEIGVEWNASGCDFSAYKPDPTPAPISAPSTAPPPAVPAAPAAPAVPSPANFAAELQSLVGANGVKNLRHVEKNEMSHKNPALRGNVKMEEKKATVVMTKPPRCELVQNKWMVENQTEKVEVEVKMNHVVYIVNCVGSHVVIKGKAKSVVIDSCKKTTVVFDSCLSTLEAVNCKQCKAQCLVNLHVAAIDKTDGFTLYVPRSCVDSLRITTSKSSDMNVSFPSEADEQDWIELPIPEQYVHTIQKDKLKTEVSDLYSCAVCCKRKGVKRKASPSSSVGRAPGS